MLPRSFAPFKNHYKPIDKEFVVSQKAGFLFMNRSVIDEDVGSEVLKVFELKKTTFQMIGREHPYNTAEEYNSHKLKMFQEKRLKGIGLF